MTKVKDLIPAGYNPRKITKMQLDRLKKSLSEFGDLSGIVFNIRTQRLIGGHQRRKFLDPKAEIIKETHTDAVGTVAIGYIDTPAGRMTYREVDWPEEKEKAANIAANKHGGEFDNIPLKALIEEIKINEMDMDLIGFDDAELMKILSSTMPAPGASTPLNKNFNANYGGPVDEIEKPTQSTQAPKYPLTFILEEEEHKKWLAKKEKIKIKNDKAAFMQLIGGENA